MKTKSSYRTLPLIPQVEKMLIEEKEKQAEMKKLFRRSYCTKYEEYVCVDAIGKIIKPNYVTNHFKVLLKENNMRPIRFHDLRHPYVKHTTKNISLQKQKSQTTNFDLIVWGFCFCVFSPMHISLAGKFQPVPGIFNSQLYYLCSLSASTDSVC